MGLNYRDSDAWRRGEDLARAARRQFIVDAQAVIDSGDEHADSEPTRNLRRHMLAHMLEVDAFDRPTAASDAPAPADSPASVEAGASAPASVPVPPAPTQPPVQPCFGDDW